MKRPNITPGPWNSQDMESSTSNAPSSWGARQEIINKDLFIGFTLSESDAKAIAAVPQLLEALELVLICPENCHTSRRILLDSVKSALLTAGYTES